MLDQKSTMKQALHFGMEGLGIFLHKIQNTMKVFVSPTIYATVQSKAAFVLSESVEVLKHLAKSDSAVIYIIEESRENIIAERTRE
ncbi:hypothetical protein PVL29_011994 [Vitis rotundifolia]|uniref:Uncharacterized protein n=1 Tax=Vitis rotundifolia TaxID=103349 RepID=A0AA39DSZ6_VITRO|nr:hypothetical protein PVL29_011994 [Vitis rotundifolia]